MPGEEKQATTMAGAGSPEVPFPGVGGARNPEKAPVRKSSGSALATQTVVGLLLVFSLILNVVAIPMWGLMAVRRVPINLAFMAVMLFAIIRAPRHPRVSLLAGVALGFDLIETFIYITIYRYAPESLYTTLGVVDSFAAAAVVLLLTLAVLSGTSPSAVN
jgi:hypothetical protein